MSTESLLPPAARRVIRLNNAFQLSFNLLWWMPVFYDYQRRSGLGDAEIFRIQSLYYLAFCFLEVPTGLIADRVGARRCLRLGAAVMIVANVLPAVRPDHTGFLVHFLLLAAARSLVSGAGSAYLYEALDGHGARERYAQAEGTARALGLAAKIVCWPFVGLVSAVATSAPYWLTALSAGVSLVCVLALPPLPRPGAPGGKDPVNREGPFAVLRGAARVFAGSRALGPLMLQGVAVFTLARICQVNLFQPLLIDKDVPVADHGLVLSAMTLAEAVTAARPVLVRRRMGDSTAVFSLTVVMAGALAAAAWANGAVTAVLLCLFAAAAGFCYPVQRQLINGAIPATPYRATLLSVESIVDRGVCALAALATGAYLGAGRIDSLLVHAALATCALLTTVAAALAWARRGTRGPQVPKDPASQESSGGQTVPSSNPRA
ncbi:MFS transporter [Streptomyces wedmorensis]|uniref:MFS transporter n=1 Tax=Streptomyces wedmorensis TaxID=43759 RepID=UPI00379246CA